MSTRVTDYRQPLHRLSPRRASTALGSLLVYAVGTLLLLILPSTTYAWQQQDDTVQEERQTARYSSNKTMPPESRPVPEFERMRRGVIAARQRGLPAGAVVHLDAGPYTGTYTVGLNDRTVLRTVRTDDFREMYGRTTGESAGAGLDAPYPRALPVGTRVRLAAGAYTGEYLRVDPGGARPGRAIDIWVPNTGEVIRFGTRKVTLKVLSACNTSLMRNDLERKYVRRKITEAEYKIKERELVKLENNFYPEAARLLDESGWTWQNADFSPNKLDVEGTRQKSPADIFYERILLDLYRMRKLITEDEYEIGRQEAVQETKEFAREIAYNVTDIDDLYGIGDFYERLPRITSGDVRVLVESPRSSPSWLELLGPWAVPLVMLIGVALTFYISIRKEKREVEQLKIQIHLNEAQARETLERTKLLLETKEFQIAEMKFKIKELQSKAERDKKDLIVL